MQPARHAYGALLLEQDRVEEAAEMVEDAFRISAQKPEERELILEVVG